MRLVVKCLRCFCFAFFRHLAQASSRTSHSFIWFLWAEAASGDECAAGSAGRPVCQLIRRPGALWSLLSHVLLRHVLPLVCPSPSPVSVSGSGMGMQNTPCCWFTPWLIAFWPGPDTHSERKKKYLMAQGKRLANAQTNGLAFFRNVQMFGTVLIVR